MPENEVNITQKSDLDRSILRAKIERDDSTTYVGDLLIRQRAINNRAIGYASPYLPPNSRVLDACAGPEGSILASQFHGYEWYGNDISRRFARHLRHSGAKNVVISNIPDAPYANNSFDAVFFVFALNNIENTQGAIGQAARIVQENGVVLVADPGPCRRVSSMLLLVAGDDLGIEFNGRKYNETIPTIVDDKKYKLEDYVAHLSRGLLGVGINDLRAIVKNIVAETRAEETNSKKILKRIEHVFHETTARMYYRHIAQMCENNGLNLQRAGLCVSSKTGIDWSISKSFDLTIGNWLNELMATRKSKGAITENIAAQQNNLMRSRERLIIPLLVFTKS